MQRLIIALLMKLLELLTPDVLKKAVDAALDAVEDAVAESENKIDDQVVLPMCKLIRNTFNVPDDD